MVKTNTASKKKSLTIADYLNSCNEYFGPNCTTIPVSTVPVISV